MSLISTPFKRRGGLVERRVGGADDLTVGDEAVDLAEAPVLNLYAGSGEPGGIFVTF